MTETGGEFWSVPVCEIENGLFPASTKWLMSGRTALRYIIEDIKAGRCIKTAALPSWCCESMAEPFLSAGIDVMTYPVYIRNRELVQDIRCDCDVLLVMDYFGHYSAADHSESGCIVIRDVTHSLFCAESRSDCLYSFGSLRKWCGFRTGGFAVKNGVWAADTVIRSADPDFVSLREKAMSQKERYLSGNFADKTYLGLFAQAEQRLDSSRSITGADEREIPSALKLDVELIRQRRLKSARILTEAFSDIAVFPVINETDCPMFVPVLVKDRDSLRSYLTKNGIYCPVHWHYPNGLGIDDRTLPLYNDELSFVCDQRYGEAEMHRIIETVKAGMQKC